MGADAAWRVTGFVLRVSSCFYLACVKNDWRIACWKLRWFPAVVLMKIMKGENVISRFTTQHRQNSGRFGLLDFILDGYFRVEICESRGLVST